MKTYLVTGGAGFIGCNFIKYMFAKYNNKINIINLDKLTYAGNLANLKEIETRENYIFVKADICDSKAVDTIFKKYHPDYIVNFAAESHVDRSIENPSIFVKTNVLGTQTLLNSSLTNGIKKFLQVSTDEVYGSLGNERYFTEETPINPHSPYSASKASADLIAKAYYDTYSLPVNITRCSNNYGPYQFPEKLIPLIVLNIMEEKDLPIYGDGKNVRDWLHVDDHCGAIWEILNKGVVGETYNIGGENEWENIRLVNILCEKMAKIKGKEKDYYKKLIVFVKDRPGHDRRYSINCDKIKNELNWKRSYDFEKGLDVTIEWYMNHQSWLERVRSGAYKKWLKRNYTSRQSFR